MQIKRVGLAVTDTDNLWRYFDFQKFLSVFIDKSLFFTRMDRMEDLNEGISMNQLLIKYGNKTEKLIGKLAPISENKRELSIEKRQQKYFLSCWLIDHRESVAMWNSYSNTDGIALRVSANNLISSIRDGNLGDDAGMIDYLYYGKVKYVDFLDKNARMKFKEGVKIIGFQKDCCFDFEKEFRFLYKQNLTQHLHVDLPFLKLKLNEFSALRFDLIFHPKMESWKKENIKTVLKSLNAINVKCQESELTLKNW